MSRLNELNKRLLTVLGLSPESAQIVMDHIEELTNEAGRLRTENVCLRQDLATLERETEGQHPPEGETWPGVVREIQSDYNQLAASSAAPTP